MDIYLVRHADALPLGMNGIATDDDRPLSDDGWRQAANLGRAFKKRGVTPELIVSSPLARSVQTATELRTVLDLADRHFETRDELAPGGRPKKLARYLNGLPWRAVVLVGHQPDLSRYAGWLLGDKDVLVEFAKAGAALIRTEASVSKGAGALLWLITPEWTE